MYILRDVFKHISGVACLIEISAICSGNFMKSIIISRAL